MAQAPEEREGGEAATCAVTQWIARLKQGDERAAAVLWENYFTRLLRQAKDRLRALPRRIADEEDVALSALNSLFDGARQARFPQLDNRDDLWKLLLVITARKAVAQRRRHQAARRPDQHFQFATDENDAEILHEVLGHEPSPETAAIFAEEYQRRLAQLPDAFFRQIVALKLQGFTNREIAQQLNTYEVKIERRLRIIRKLWSQESEHEPSP